MREHLTERLERGRLDVGRRAQVARADFDLEPRRNRRLRVVRDRVLGDDVVGDDDEVAGLGAELRRPPRDFGDAALEIADANPVADAKRLLALNAKPGERVPERVLEREADDHGADRRGREELVLEHERRDEHQEADDHRVLEDRRKRVRDPVRAQRVDENVDEEVDDGRGEDQPLETAEDRRRARAAASGRCQTTRLKRM